MDSIADDLAAVANIAAVPNILEVVCHTTGLGFAAVARVTEDRWVACAVRDEISFGLEPGGELKVRTTICNEIRDSGQLVVIEHAAEDQSFCNHATPKMYGFQSYISVPIRRPEGQFFGTLCAIDPRPARLNRPETINMFKLFADLIGFHLDAQEKLAVSEKALVDARETAELREQFIAVLGHDLRNPLASIDAGARVLLKSEPGGNARTIIELMQQSTSRMARLIENVLDFARGRLGGGLFVSPALASDLGEVLEQVVAELRSVWPDRTIESEWALREAVSCDTARIAQLLSNLLANALSHGDPAGPVRIQGRGLREGGFELFVANAGEPIPPEIVKRLFQPFRRGLAGQQGLGLGLYIASEIARAHGGTLDVVSTAEETRFTLRVPPPAGPAGAA